MSSEKIYQMRFAKVYPLLVAKAERKGRTKEEVDRVICWLTGYTPAQIEEAAAGTVSYGRFFEDAPCMNPNRVKITGSVCGVRVETVEDPFMRDVRYLDKLVDELAKGKAVERILPG
ncbi:MAG: DUF2200 domain-containing protein [Oscillospiraceae bacterium]|nr:DUF2200 domain-containing protein [Oscillospiraceae bacterium]